MTPAMKKAYDIHSAPVLTNAGDADAFKRSIAIRKGIADDSLKAKLTGFRLLFDKLCPSEPQLPDEFEQTLRCKLLEEELVELWEAQTLEDWVDALGDLIIVACDGLVALGVNPDLVLEEINASNMTKRDPAKPPLIREDGKMMKDLEIWEKAVYTDILAPLDPATSLPSAPF